MTLDEKMKYDAEKEHPHIRDDGTIKEDGIKFALEEFERKMIQEGVGKAMKFYKKLIPEGQAEIKKKYNYRFINMRTCKFCSQYVDGV
jgi:hypothetical protein